VILSPLLHLIFDRLKPGDEVQFAGGTYYDMSIRDLAGTASNYIQIRSKPGELAVFDGNGFICWQLGQLSYVYFENIEISGLIFSTID
jgi:hypothetical protein